MINRNAAARLCLVLSGIAVASASTDLGAQTVVCFVKKCVVFSDGRANCSYIPVDCSKVEIQ